jgi:hypothetical protein
MYFSRRSPTAGQAVAKEGGSSFECKQCHKHGLLPLDISAELPRLEPLPRDVIMVIARCYIDVYSMESMAEVAQLATTLFSAKSTNLVSFAASFLVSLW